MNNFRFNPDRDSEKQLILESQISNSFKILFDYQVEEDYKMSSISTIMHPHNSSRPLSRSEQAELCTALCYFIEDATNMTYEEVEKKYGCEDDTSDWARDLKTPGKEFQIVHYKLAEKGLGKLARIHGYIIKGVFVVKRIDWGHHFHEKYYPGKADAE